MVWFSVMAQTARRTASRIVSSFSMACIQMLLPVAVVAMLPTLMHINGVIMMAFYMGLTVLAWGPFSPSVSTN